MDIAEFRNQLESLEEGDSATFTFKGMVHWATNFLALFNVKPHALELSGENVLSFDIINEYMMAKWISTSSWPVTCNVLKRLSQAQVNVDWMLEYIFPLLKDFTVQKAQKPE